MTSDVQARQDNLIAVTAIFDADTAVTELADLLQRLNGTWKFSMACARLMDRDLLTKVRAATYDGLDAQPGQLLIDRYGIDLAMAVASSVEPQPQILRQGGLLNDAAAIEVSKLEFSVMHKFMDTRDGGEARLAFRSLRMNSPLELDLVGLCQTVPGEVALGVLLFERLVKLAMKWQRQQADLRQDMRRRGVPDSMSERLTEADKTLARAMEEDVVAAVPALARDPDGTLESTPIGRIGSDRVRELMKYRLVRRQ